MKILSVLDPACFIWDEQDFLQRKNFYYDLLDDLVDLFDTLESGKFEYILRSELLDILTNSFPVRLIDQQINREDLYEIINLFFLFISKIGDNLMDYEPLNNNTSSDPNMKRNHYNINIIEEIDYLLTKLSEESQNLIGISLGGIWDKVNMITLYNSDGEEVKDIQFITDHNELESFIFSSEPTFIPSPKHKPGYGWGTPLPEHLEERCYELIRKTVKENENSEALYAYCEVYNQYVKFRLTVNNIYHAYPITEEEVPSLIARQLTNF